ncbi:unnamed protein product [Dibothriocephalus latus]|uniref:Ig-like domain-containing protein n=1 Tax=Dibothriocephalus latus TaxID=60516 RepID=A0A3P7L8L9_DIBLA|nr:unnamed protein product [Dibothriocephalus latus]
MINPVTPTDSGSYRCTVLVNGKTHSKEIELNVLVPPKIVKAPASTLKLVEGDTLQLSCVAEGNPRPTVTWLIQPFNRNLLPLIGRTMLPARRVLELLELIPPEIDMLNPLIKQSLARDTVLQCTANANPLGNIIWSFGVNKQRINASTCSILTDKKEKYCLIESRPRPEEPFSVLVSKLHVFNLAEEDFGEYFCSMSTMMGRASAKTLLERKFLKCTLELSL